ncbi:MAG: nucleoside recognition protein [Bacteroidales bacterium]|nr:nucleoside recognition protein [Bacteroidales bacterium]
MKKETVQKLKKCIAEVLPTTTKTCIWILKLTVGVSFAMMLLKYFNILPYISDFVNPVFRYFGLPGDAALAFVSGYFVNVYSAIAVMATIEMDVRSITILSTMVLCAHSMILETAVLKKTGTNAVRMVINRTLGALALGFVLNLVLPGASVGAPSVDPHFGVSGPFLPVLGAWALNTLKLCLTMIVIIYTLNILQRILTEFGIVRVISRFLKPVMLFFGLPENTAFLWIIANIVGLGYGAAAMLDELARGEISSSDVDYLDTHICVSHSNFEDLLLLSACGAVWWILLLFRWALSFVLVWELRLENYLFRRNKE